MPGWDTRSRRASEPALTADELQRLRWGLGGALALLSAWGVFFFDLSGTTLLLPITALVVAVLLKPAWPGRVPAWGARLVVPGLVLFVAADVVLNFEPLAALVRVNLLLIAIRALGYRRPREDLQLVVLCLFLVVVAGVLTVSIGFVLHILLFTALALTYLLVITLSTTAESDGGAAWQTIHWGRLLRRLRRAVDWKIVAACSGLYLLVVAMASLLFIAMPRFQVENSLEFLQLQNRRSLSGFSDSVKFGDVTDIAQDTTTALRAELDDPTKVPALPYWRMVVLDEYRDGGFQTSRGLARRDHDLGETRELVGLREGAPPKPVWTFYFEAGVSRYLPLTGNFRVLQLREQRMLMANLASNTLALRMEPQSMFAYRVEGLDLSGELEDPGLAGALRAPPRRPSVDYPHTLLAVPAGEAEGAALTSVVVEITGGKALSAAEFARKAVEWLEQRHRYSMRSAVPPGGEDVLVRWLRSDAPGHCELFAGGFTLLARRAGFPVRVVVGFKGGAWNSFEQYYMVRNSDAHAWCELYDERGRWVRVDPTPGASAEAAAATASGVGRANEVDSSWTARFDALRMLWYRRIVNFDRGTQEELADTLKAATRRTGQALIEMTDRWGRAVRDWVFRPWNFQRFAKWGTVLVCGVVMIFAAWRWRYRWWLRWTRGGRGDPVRREAGRWLRRMAQAELADEAQPVVRQLERLRYGPTEGRPIPTAVFRLAKRAWRARP